MQVLEKKIEAKTQIGVGDLGLTECAKSDGN